jgi:hypothetical protein
VYKRQFSKLNKDEQIKALDILYKLGREIGYAEFVKANPEFKEATLSAKQELVKEVKSAFSEAFTEKAEAEYKKKQPNK